MRLDLQFRVDLREYPAAAEIQKVAEAFATTLLADRAVRKLRTVNLPTGRGTWVRIEARSVEHIDGQGWNGVECAATLRGVARPDWRQAISWRDGDLMWRADETDLVTASPIRVGPMLTVDPDLPDTWWDTLTASLSALAAHRTTRIAMQTMQPLTQEHLTATIGAVFPDVDSTVDEWTTAHSDLGWHNLTAPDCTILDWEDWGLAPRGLDAASLWLDSLAVPALAERVYRELRPDLDSRSGLLCQLMGSAMAAMLPTDILPPGYERLTDPAKAQAPRILEQLTSLRSER
jgi:hypothetical protein